MIYWSLKRTIIFFYPCQRHFFFNIRSNHDEAVAFFTNGEGVVPEVFPAIVSCPVCQKKLKATKAGRFRCSGCKSIIAINADAEVSLG